MERKEEKEEEEGGWIEKEERGASNCHCVEPQQKGALFLFFLPPPLLLARKAKYSLSKKRIAQASKTFIISPHYSRTSKGGGAERGLSYIGTTCVERRERGALSSASKSDSNYSQARLDDLIILS